VTDEQLEPEAIENALAETAEKPDNDFPELNSRDIRYGTGIIDVNAAAEALTGDDVQTIEGTVTDAETGEPIVGATVESAEGALTSTDEDGEYTLTVTSDPAEITDGRLRLRRRDRRGQRRRGDRLRARTDPRRRLSRGPAGVRHAR